MRRGLFVLLLVVGWTMILVVNRLHVTAPVVVICLAYFAAVTTAFMLFRLGASAVTRTREDLSPLAWGAPIGTRGELEREKRMLLKAIKESEFDHEMGKLSKADADQMIAVYRKRAIEIIKQLDADGAGHSAREQIEAEVRARLALAAEKPAKRKKAKQGASATSPAPAKAAATIDVKPDVKSEVGMADAPAKSKSKPTKAEVAKAEAAAAEAEAAAAAARAAAAAAKVAALEGDDDHDDDDDDDDDDGPMIHQDSADAGDAMSKQTSAKQSAKREEAVS